MLKNPTVPIRKTVPTPSHLHKQYTWGSPGSCVSYHTTSVSLLRLLGQKGLSFLPRVANSEVGQHGIAQVAWVKKMSWTKDESLHEV